MKISELKRKYNYIYQLIMILLVFTVIVSYTSELTTKLTSAELQMVTTINYIIWFIFVLDYIGRFYIAKNRKRFFKVNLIDLISILPFHIFFRFGKAIYVTKNLKYLKYIRFSLVVIIMVFFRKMKRNINFLIKKNPVFYIIWLTVLTIFFGAVGMYFAEGQGFIDSLWWSFVTATTVGYGDISPRTPMGRIIAAFLMITGIGLIGMLTGNITSFFLSRRSTNVTTYKSEVIDNIKNKLDDFDELTDEDIDDIYKTLKALKN